MMTIEFLLTLEVHGIGDGIDALHSEAGADELVAWGP
jgi:hypothetical protein